MARPQNLGTHFVVGHQAAAERSAFAAADSAGMVVTAKYAKYAEGILIYFVRVVRVVRG